MYALASVTLCDNLLIGRYKKSPMPALTDVGPKRLKVRENARAFSREKKTVHNNRDVRIKGVCVSGVRLYRIKQ